jgi:ATP-binding cassette subfamily C protein
MRRSAHIGENAKNKQALSHMDAVQNALSSPMFLAFFDLPWSPIFFAALFIFHPILGWLGLAGGLVLLVLTISNQLLSRNKMIEQNQQKQMASIISDQSINAADTARAMGMTRNMSLRWLGARDDGQEAGMAYSDTSGFFQSMTKSTRMLLQSTMLAAGAWLVLQGELSAGAMIAGTILLGRALAPIEQGLGQWRQLQTTKNAWNSLQSFLNDNPAEPQKTELPRPEALLQMSEVAIRPPGATKPTVGGITFEVKQGEVLGIIGKSGSGKSTIVRALVGLWFPHVGEVRLGGAKLDNYDADLLGSYIGYLPQDPKFFTGTIAENIARMAQKPDEQEVIRAAKAAHVHDLILTLPRGYDTLLDGDAVQLSGGQRQRVGLARALYGGPEVYIFDEPNSALDVEGSTAFNRAVTELKEAGKAVVIATHRPAALGVVDNLVLIEDGAIQTAGPRDEVIAKVRGAQGASAAPSQGARMAEQAEFLKKRLDQAALHKKKLQDEQAQAQAQKEGDDVPAE